MALTHSEKSRDLGETEAKHSVLEGNPAICLSSWHSYYFGFIIGLRKHTLWSLSSPHSKGRKGRQKRGLGAMVYSRKDTGLKASQLLVLALSLNSFLTWINSVNLNGYQYQWGLVWPQASKSSYGLAIEGIYWLIWPRSLEMDLAAHRAWSSSLDNVTRIQLLSFLSTACCDSSFIFRFHIMVPVSSRHTSPLS